MNITGHCPRCGNAYPDCKCRSLYTFGYSDPIGQYGIMAVGYIPPKKSYSMTKSYIIAGIGYGISASMMLAPMAWVEMFKWMLS